MGKWDLYGTERKRQFERDLEPAALKKKLFRYQREMGKSFGLTELLALEDIRAKALLAETINDMPEFLLDQLGKMKEEGINSIIPDSLDHIADAWEGYLDKVCHQCNSYN